MAHRKPQSKACTNVYYNKQRALRIAVHGDDFLCAGPEEEVKNFKLEMGQGYESKHEPMGPRNCDKKSLKVLNRELRWHQEKTRRKLTRSTWERYSRS